MPLCAVGADAGDDGERDVLGADPRAEPAVDRDPRPPGLLLPQGLGHQHRRNLSDADAERIGAEGAMGRGVAVAAHDQRPGTVSPCSGATT
jgi:hypothetical protein